MGACKHTVSRGQFHKMPKKCHLKYQKRSVYNPKTFIIENVKIGTEKPKMYLSFMKWTPGINFI